MREAPTNFFPLPNEIFMLELSPGEIAVYAYLLYREDRVTYKCYPSYGTIAKALHISRNTVRKYVDKLREKRLIDTEQTMVFTRDGMESIKDRGVITPAMVRKKDDGRYEMISGHRRKHASERLGLETLRCEVVEVSRDEAIILMVDSNAQRSVILPCDKGRAFKMKLEALKRQGQRTDLTSTPTACKLKGETADKRRNGNLMYTIRPINDAVELYFQKQLARAEKEQEKQRMIDSWEKMQKQNPSETASFRMNLFESRLK